MCALYCAHEDDELAVVAVTIMAQNGGESELLRGSDTVATPGSIAVFSVCAGNFPSRYLRKASERSQLENRRIPVPAWAQGDKLTYIAIRKESTKIMGADLEPNFMMALEDAAGIKRPKKKRPPRVREKSGMFRRCGW